MKLVKIFGIVMAFHGAAFLFIFAIPGCRSTSKKPAAAATVTGDESSPIVAAADPMAPSVDSYQQPDLSPVRFSPTRPGTPAATEVTAPVVPATSTHTVVKGDNLWSIARKNEITVKQLTAANNMRADSPLKIGQVLTIPGKPAAQTVSSTSRASASTASTAPAAAPASAFTHVIKSGETLGGIAKRYQVKVGDIATANNIADPTKIRAGQTLKIPGWQAPASSSSSSASTTRTTRAVSPAPAPTNTAPALAPAAPAPLAPVFESPVSPVAPAPEVDELPFITPAPDTSSDAPMIRVEESGAPRIE